ncbi:hypothetical protein CDAR_264591 [Caerostris darwini]|uniref:Uncharacterized protein n=1 Tax=Caerostris darwini TaxID=1538125 RepID=A0AAV4NKN1_9ARAC|nr:hypothetical protein CDAR_264591 [Caerostris darwini]
MLSTATSKTTMLLHSTEQRVEDEKFQNIVCAKELNPLTQSNDFKQSTKRFNFTPSVPKIKNKTRPNPISRNRKLFYHEIPALPSDKHPPCNRHQKSNDFQQSTKRFNFTPSVPKSKKKPRSTPIIRKLFYLEIPILPSDKPTL